MSKLLAMMMKPKNYMYATIKGSLTENNGVFSGFSASSYLQLQQILSDINNFEIQIKIQTSTSTSAYRIILASLETREMTLAQGSSSKLLLQVGNNGSSYVVELTGTTNLQPLTDYYIRVIYNNGTFSLLLSSDGINWNNEGSINYTISTVTFIFGNGWNLGANYWRGSIDLNQSYIKINNTKYQLQAVVGYTVVGSPTIVDGVVSGFSSSDYLTLPNAIINNSDFELKTVIVPNTIINMRVIAQNVSSTTFTGVNIVTSALRFSINTGTERKFVNNSLTLEANTKYYIVCYRKKTIIGIRVSTDNINWINNTENILETDNIVFENMRIGRASTTFDGSIYVSETQIKIDNKLWFNGQPA